MMDRRDGFHDAIKGTGHTIVEGPYAEYIRANAVTAMQDLLQANADVKVVYAHNDDMALGALQVLKENNRNDVLVAASMVSRKRFRPWVPAANMWQQR